MVSVSDDLSAFVYDQTFCPQVLVLTPTRELAIQVAKDFKDIVKTVSVACFYGGSSYNPQSKS